MTLDLRPEQKAAGFHVADWLTDTRDIRFDRGMPGDGVIDIPRIRGLVEQAGYSGIARIMRRDNMDVRPLLLAEHGGVPEDCAAIVIAGPDRRTVGELHRHVLETEGLVDGHQQFADALRFIDDLLFGTEDVRVILGEGTHPHQAVQRSGWFIAMA